MSRGSVSIHWAIVLLGTIALFACQSERVDPFDAPEPELATEDIGSSPTDGLTGEQDQQARRREVSGQSGLVGRLPSTFPSDLPPYQPSSVVDFSDEGAVPAFVELRTTHGQNQVHGFYTERMVAGGWTAVSASKWEKQGRTVEILIRDEGPASRVVRIVY